MDRPQGDDWWQAADQKWYPPESRLQPPPPPPRRETVLVRAARFIGKAILISWVLLMGLLFWALPLSSIYEEADRSGGSAGGEMAVGVIWGVVCLAGVGYAIWKIVRWHPDR